MYFTFNKFSQAQLEETILNVTKNENIKISQDALHKLANLASGHARDVLSMLEQLAMLTNNDITSDDINKVFGLVDIQNKINFINQIISGNVNDSLNTLNDFYQSGVNLEILCSDLFTIVLDKIIYSQTNNISILKALDESTVDQIDLSINKLFKVAKVFEEKSAGMKNASDAKFYFECIILAIIGELIEGETPIAKPIVEKKVAKQTIEVKQEETTKTTKLPDLKDIFSTKEFKQHKPQKEASTNKDALNVENVFYAATNSFNKANLQKGQEYLKQIMDDHDPVLQYVKSAIKPIIVGNDAMVLLYEDPIDAELLNNNLNNNQFHEKINKLLHKHMYLIGLTNSQVKNISDIYLSNRKEVVLPKYESKTNLLDLFDSTIKN
jgi:DNA polymerase-3 subunit gamma/tau